MMNNIESTADIQNAINWMMVNSVMLKNGVSRSKHTAFSYTPTIIKKARFDQLIKAAPIFGKLLSAVASDTHFLRQAIEPVAADDAFFHELLNMHQAIH